MKDLDNDKLDRARKKVKDIKGFYTHLVIYLIINVALTLVHMGILSGSWAYMEIPSWPHFMSPFFWGIGLFFHGLYVFQHKFSFFRGWEERKIKEYMDKDDEDFEKTNKWN